MLYNLEPITRKEKFYDKILNSNGEDLTPVTREEMWLDDIAEAVSGGGGGGTTDYTDLNNKPQINSVTLSGNKSLSDIGAQPTINNDNKLAGSLSVLTGYEQAETAADLAATDTVNQAFGKIEKRVSDNENNILTLQGKTVGMSEGGSNYITVGGIRVYVSATAPTGARTGDMWIGG